MRHSQSIQNLRDEQRDEIMKKTAAERLLIAFELSNTCTILNNAARKALEEKRVTAMSENFW
jgi:hypothetical protein